MDTSIDFWTSVHKTARKSSFLLFHMGLPLGWWRCVQAVRPETSHGQGQWRASGTNFFFFKNSLEKSSREFIYFFLYLFILFFPFFCFSNSFFSFFLSNLFLLFSFLCFSSYAPILHTILFKTFVSGERPRRL